MHDLSAIQAADTETLWSTTVYAHSRAWVHAQVGPFPMSPWQNKHLLVVVDYCSKWVELFPLRSVKTPIIANILLKDMFTRSAYLVSDGEPQAVQ